MSRIREQFTAPPLAEVPLAADSTADLLPYVVFTQLRSGGPFIYAGWLEAADDDMAIAFAREHYGQDQECVNVMAVRREHITSSDGLYGSPLSAGEGSGVRASDRSGPGAVAGNVNAKPSPQPSPKGRGGATFHVFTQKKAGDLWISAGTIQATDPHAAIEAAKSSIRQAQSAHVVWVVDAAHVISPGAGDLIWRHTDQSYRLARGYGRVVRAKWTQFRDEKALAEYEREDLKEGF